MADALVLVKKDLGKDAVILHTRVYKIGTILGFGGKPQVEVTASLGVNTPPRGGGNAPSGGGRGAGASPQARTGVARAYGVGGTGGASPGVPVGAAVKPVNSPMASAVRDVAEIAMKASAVESAARDTSVKPDAAAGAAATAAQTTVESPALDASATRQVDGSARGGSSSSTDKMYDELAAIKRMVGQVLQSGGGGGGGGAGTMCAALPMPQALLDMYMRLIEAEVSRELADELVADLRDELSTGEMRDAQVVRAALLRKLEGLFPACAAGGHVPPSRVVAGQRPFTVALVGPTGVGKTTTLAKLAAAHKLRHGKRVGMITCDTYRIAAVEQLRTYANIIGVPLKVVLTPEELRRACDELRECDVVLIDTAGRSPSDATKLDELQAFIRAAQPDQTHLVLSTVAGQTSLTRAAEKFAQIKPDHLIFTKLDEAVNFGLVVNVTQRVQSLLNVKLSYVTTGQEVPDDIEPVRADRLARLVLEGALPR